MKRNVVHRKIKIEVHPSIGIGLLVAALLALIIFVVMPSAIRAHDKAKYIKEHRTTVLNAYPPKDIEAVLSEVRDEEGNVISVEERILIKYEKIRDISFSGSSLRVEFLWDDNIFLPNVTLAEWKTAVAQFDSEE